MSLFNGIKWPYATMQQLNLDWIMDKVKKLTDFLPDNGNTGDLLVRSDEGAAWEAPGDALDDLLNDTGWIDIPNTAAHYRRKNGYVTVVFDASTATTFHGSSDWETIGQLGPGLRPANYVFFYLGAGGHSNDIKGTGYIGPNGVIGIYFPEECTTIGGYVIYPV